jgi:hypothetical protein
MDGTVVHVKPNKSDQKRQKSHVLFHMWNLDKRKRKEEQAALLQWQKAFLCMVS